MSVRVVMVGATKVHLFPSWGTWRSYACSHQTRLSWSKSHQTRLASDGYLYVETKRNVSELDPSQHQSTDSDPGWILFFAFKFNFHVNAFEKLALLVALWTMTRFVQLQKIASVDKNERRLNNLHLPAADC